MSMPIKPIEIPRPPVPQPAERLFLLVSNQENPLAYGLGGNAYQMSSGPVFRRATPDDLHAFGFEAIAPGVPADPSQGALVTHIVDTLDRMTTGLRTTVLAMLKEKYG